MTPKLRQLKTKYQIASATKHLQKEYPQPHQLSGTLHNPHMKHLEWDPPASEAFNSLLFDKAVVFIWLYYYKSHEMSCKATTSKARHIKHIVTNYEEASGHAINFIKSVIAFSANTSPDVVSSIIASLVFYGNIGSKKYLGLPFMVGRSKRAIFSYIKYHIWKKCQFCSSRSTSRVGKEILIKSVAQAIPSSCMGAFLIPASLCEEIERMMNSFYWCSKKCKARHKLDALGQTHASQKFRRLWLL